MYKVLFPALSVCLASSVAMAEPVQLTSLQLDELTAGSVTRTGTPVCCQPQPKDKDVVAKFDEDFNLDLDIKKDKAIQILKQVDVWATGYVDGNLADAEALAEALGDNTLAETLVFTFTNYDLSTSYAEALSVTD